MGGRLNRNGESEVIMMSDERGEIRILKDQEVGRGGVQTSVVRKHCSEKSLFTGETGGYYRARKRFM